MAALPNGQQMNADRELLKRCFTAAIAAVDPAAVLQRQLRINAAAGVFRRGAHEWSLPLLASDARGALRLIAIGKAAGPFARAFCRVATVHSGIVIAPADAPADVPGLLDVAADHPDPGAASRYAALRLLQFIETGSATDRYVVLLTGGASALCVLPIEGLDDCDKRQAVRVMMDAGATIAELNALRKHLSQLKGGRLAERLSPASWLTFAISDVRDDDPAVIGSGPTVADPTTFDDVLQSIARLGIERQLPPAVMRCLHDGVAGQLAETPKPGELRPMPYLVIASLDDALEAAADFARKQDLQVISLGRTLYGQVETEALRLQAEVRKARASLAADSRAMLLLVGGEPIVQVRGEAAGGRAQHLALLLARSLVDCPQVTVLAAGTDGIDGRSSAAGGFADCGSWSRIRNAGIDPAAALTAAASHSALAAAGDLFTTGRTATNVADIVMILIRAG